MDQTLYSNKEVEVLLGRHFFLKSFFRFEYYVTYLSYTLVSIFTQRYYLCASKS